MAAFVKSRVDHKEFLINYLPIDALTIEDLLGYHNKETLNWYEGILEKVLDTAMVNLDDIGEEKKDSLISNEDIYSKLAVKR